MHYVAVSRVTSLLDLYLKSLNSDKICVSPNVMNYVEKAKEKYKLKLFYTPLYMYSDNRLCKIIQETLYGFEEQSQHISCRYHIIV